MLTICWPYRYEWWLGFDWFGASNGIIGGHENEPRPKPGIVTRLCDAVLKVFLCVFPFYEVVSGTRRVPL